MSNILLSTRNSKPMNCCSHKAIVYVWDRGIVQEITSGEYLQKRDSYAWKYAYLHDPNMGKWDAVMTEFKHGYFYIYKKNMKIVRRKDDQHHSALYTASHSEVPKDFKANLFLLGVQI